LTGILLAAHGSLAAAALELVEMLSGPKENVRCISFAPGQSLDGLIADFTRELDSLGALGDVLVLTDIKGGSPCNIATVMQKTRENVKTLYGFNIPMLLQVFDDIQAGLGMDEILENAVEVGRFSINRITFK
jgi:mannose/fructose/sorbose-specific phosphotransferase system IIA component